jgi:hypothetical protein
MVVLGIVASADLLHLKFVAVKAREKAMAPLFTGLAFVLESEDQAMGASLGGMAPLYLGILKCILWRSAN